MQELSNTLTQSGNDRVNIRVIREHVTTKCDKRCSSHLRDRRRSRHRCRVAVSMQSESHKGRNIINVHKISVFLDPILKEVQFIRRRRKPFLWGGASSIWVQICLFWFVERLAIVPQFLHLSVKMKRSTGQQYKCPTPRSCVCK